MNTDIIKYCIPPELIAGIYKIQSPDGHYYIGSTKNFKKRFKSHQRELVAKNHCNTYMQNVFNKNKYGWQFILVEPVGGKQNLLQLEQNYINLHYKDNSCMNICEIVEKPPVCRGHSVDTKLKMKKAKSVTHRRNISKAKAGVKIKPHSAEALIRKSLRHKGISWSEARRSAENERKKIGKISILKNRPWSEARRAAHYAKSIYLVSRGTKLGSASNPISISF
jgi:group I intron endonuclease